MGAGKRQCKKGGDADKPGKLFVDWFAKSRFHTFQKNTHQRVGYIHFRRTHTILVISCGFFALHRRRLSRSSRVISLAALDHVFTTLGSCTTMDPGSDLGSGHRACGREL